MATITLYKNKVNGVGSLLDDIIKSSNNLNTQLGTLKNTLQGVNSSSCNLQDTVDSISSSSKSEKEKVEDLKKLNGKLTEFIETTSRRDSSAKHEIEKSKKDFYTKYSYLKPNCEKSTVEKIVDGMQKACEWCKENWKLIAAIVIVAVSIVLLCTGVGGILAGACWGAILGACIGGVSGGVTSLLKGESFLKGFGDGAFSGAVSGAITGAFGAGFKLAGTAMSVGQKIVIGGLGDMGAQILGDIGDILIKGDKISPAEFILRAGTAFGLGCAFSGVSEFVSGKISIKLDGINKGTGSWSHVANTQLTKAIRYSNKMGMKTIFKGIGAKAVNDFCDIIFDPFKSGAQDLMNDIIIPKITHSA